MNCPECGEVCHCNSESVGAFEAAAEVAAGADPNAWRDQVAAKLNRYRSRHKVRPPRYPSLSLRFEPFESAVNGDAASQPSGLPKYEPLSNHALALDGVEPRTQPATKIESEFQAPVIAQAALPPAEAPARELPTRLSGGKIIEFPRFAWAPPPPPPDQLAEPVIDRPRILDVPEIEPPPPALGGITIEAARQQEPEKRPGIDIPLQSAPVILRVIAGFIDAVIIAAASALFAFIFWKVAAFRPPLPQSLGLGIGIPGFFWAAYEYLLLVYSGSTPGLRLARLELCRFDGSPTHRSLRRWRVLAGWLSALSLAMGYAWILLDEDNLCWHDRITHTYLGPKKRLTPNQG